MCPAHVFNQSPLPGLELTLCITRELVPYGHQATSLKAHRFFGVDLSSLPDVFDRH
jgi:hypothetical protein